jgi:cation diffusion facilitator family transporter
LIVAIMIFAVGGGISLYEGIHHIIHPTPIENAMINYIVLGFSIIFEGVSWTFAFIEFRKIKGDMGYIEAVHKSKDPTTFTVFLEDSAALAGLVVALVGIWLGQALNAPVFDGIASTVIGVILGVVAIFLAIETKSLLIGEAADPVIVDDIHNIAEKDPAVTKFVEARTMHFGPYNVLLTMDLVFDKSLPSEDVAEAVDRMEREIRSRHPEISYIYLEAKSVLPEKKEKPKAD